MVTRRQVKRYQWPLLGVGLGALVFFLWWWAKPNHQHNELFLKTNSAAVAPEPRCHGWQEEVALSPEQLISYAGEGWQALREGRPYSALGHFRRASQDEPSNAAGLFRSEIELATALNRARKASLLAMEGYLDRLLESPPKGLGDEVFYFLRASVAVQAGQPDSLHPYLSRIPDDSPLRPAATVLETIHADPVSRYGDGPAAPAVRWLQHLESYAHALRDIGPCPWSGVAVARADNLADWFGSDFPAPRQWPSDLDLSVPDYIFGGCDPDAQFKVRLYDPLLYTTLSALVLEKALETPAETPFARFYRNQALSLLHPEEASKEACTLAKSWHETSVSDSLPWLIFGDWANATSIKKALESSCSGYTHVSLCPASFDEARDTFDKLDAWSSSCTESLGQRSPSAGEVVRRLQLFAGDVRRGLETRILDGDCSQNQIYDYLMIWKGAERERSRWENLETSLALCVAALETNRYEAGLSELLQLSRQNGLFLPLFEMARSARAANMPTSGGEGLF